MPPTEYDDVSKDRRVRLEPYTRATGTYHKRIVEVRCCGIWIDCDRFTVTCDRCGADYNQSGDRLAPREQWGEETGEHWTDCY